MQFDEVYLESLFAQAESFLADNPYKNIGDSPSFFTKIKGVSMEGRQELVKQLTEDTPVYLERDPYNPHDLNAIKVVTNQGNHLGFLSRQMAAVIAPLMDAGEEYSATISMITGGNGKNYGVNLLILKESAYQVTIEPGLRNKLAQLPDKALLEKIKKVVLGPWEYHDKQKEAIQTLQKGDNCLVVMGTGRGKSSIFQTVSAYRALKENKITVIVYPLRALSNDQYTSMQSMFASLGLRVYRANGGLGTEDRASVFQAMAAGDMDILLTTPEFIIHHAEKLGPLIERIGLFVVDEAHHLYEDSHRPAYRRLDKVVSLLGGPQVLAVTATANTEAARQISDVLGIKRIIVDSHVRENLKILDARGCKEKERYLLYTVKNSKKSIVYVGTRKETVRLAKLIREQIPELAHKVCFYHGGLSSKDRQFVEEMFKSDHFRVIVATNAFGEGINVTNIRDVILYNFLYNFTEFNQQSGRAGRNGESAQIHILFSEADSALNWRIIQNQAPSKEQMDTIYRALRKAAPNASNKELAEMAKEMGAKGCNETLVSNALGILEELRLIHRETLGNKRTIEINPDPERVKLSSSVRLQEGIEELNEFTQFRLEILNMSKENLEFLVQRPITPDLNKLHKKADVINWL